jgi:hypothetical protein
LASLCLLCDEEIRDIQLVGDNGLAKQVEAEANVQQKQTIAMKGK